MSRIIKWSNMSGPPLPSTPEALAALATSTSTLSLKVQVHQVIKVVLPSDEEFRGHAAVLVNGMVGNVAKVRMADIIQAKAKEMEGFEDVVRADTPTIIAKMNKVLAHDYKGLSVRDRRLLALEAAQAAAAAAVDQQLAQ